MPVRYIKRNCIFLGIIASLFTLKVYASQISENELYSPKAQNEDTDIKIGLLVNDSSNFSAQHAAELAISEANKNENLSGIRFKLLIRSVEGRWGAGSKQSVKLVYEDKVWAIVGSLDGRNAHLTEQVATKAHIVFLSTWATDPTLSQAFVPWYFRCIPNDLQQSKVLINEIYNNKSPKKTIIVSDKSYDAFLSAKSFIKEVAIAGKSAPELMVIEDASSKNTNKIISEIIDSKTENVFVCGNSEVTREIISQIRHKSLKINIYGMVVLAEQTAGGEFQKHLGGAKIVSSNHWFTEEGKSFQNKFFETYGYIPNARAAYAFDGINLIIDAIYKSGFDNEKIKDSLHNMNYKNGITGVIEFDKMGNRIDNGSLMKIIKGKPASVRISN